MYRYIYLLLILNVGCISQHQESNEKISIRYFSKITGIISPYMDYKPRGELDVTDITGNSYYKVVYDAQGNIFEMRYFKNEEKSNDSYFGTHRIVYNYYKDSLLRRYFDTNEKKAHMNRHYYGGGNIHKEFFLLDKEGIKHEMTLRDTLDNKVSNGFGTYKYVWKTDLSGEFIQEQYKRDGNRNVLTNYFPFYSAKITMDTKGHLYSITNLDTLTATESLHREAGYAKVIFDFDKFGNEKGWGFYTLDHKLTARKQVADMEFGYAKVVYDFDWKNQELGLSRSFSMRFLNESLDPVKSNDSIHATILKFDDNENLLSISYFDEHNYPKVNQSVGYHKVKLVYDDNGRQTGMIRFDENEKEI